MHLLYLTVLFSEFSNIKMKICVEKIVTENMKNTPLVEVFVMPKSKTMKHQREAIPVTKSFETTSANHVQGFSFKQYLICKTINLTLWHNLNFPQDVIPSKNITLKVKLQHERTLISLVRLLTLNSFLAGVVMIETVGALHHHRNILKRQNLKIKTHESPDGGETPPII